MKIETRQRIVYIISDWLMAVAGLLIFNIARVLLLKDGDFDLFIRWSTDPNVVKGYIVFPLMMVFFYVLSGFYNEPVYKSRFLDFSNSAIGAFFGALMVYFVAVINDGLGGRILNYELMAVLWVAFFLPTFVMRYAIGAAVRRRIARGGLPYNVLIVGTSPRAVSYGRRLSETNAAMGYKVVGYVDLHGNGSRERVASDGLSIYAADNIADFADRLDVKAFVLVPDGDDSISVVLDSINRLYTFDRKLFISPDLYHLLTSRPRVTSVVGEPLVDISTTNLSPATSNIKRLVDITVAAVSMVILAPVFGAIALAVKIDSKGPVLYRQERIGRHRHPFRIIKFRTMIVDSEPDGPALSSAVDPRVTRVGRFLRKYRLDEIPQFWNVFVGEMSLVGPRPEREYYLTKLAERAPYVCMIHKLRPGITSFGLVKYGYACDVDQMVERVKYDLIYLENVSPAFDIKILFYTVRTVLTGKGV